MFRCIYANSRFLAKLANGKIRVEATDWPAFLYDPANADPDDVEKGLFTGDLLFNVCHYAFAFSHHHRFSRYSMLFSLAKAPL